MQRVFTGNTFGFWTVVEYRPFGSLCLCRCGVKKVIRNATLTNRTSSKCKDCVGLARRDVSAEMPMDLYNRLVLSVDNAIRRCTDKNHRQWNSYGGRGIAIYPPWLENKKEFVKYLATLSGCNDTEKVLDRINNEEGYLPGNLRFVSYSVSSLNRRKFSHKQKHDSCGRFYRKHQ